MTRLLWQHVEPYHAVTYFASEHRDACERVGLHGGWMAYFASRAAPLGRVQPGVVAALFYGFHPAMVTRSIPDAWSYAEPTDVLAARSAGVDLALRRLLGEAIGSDELWAAALLSAAAASELRPEGRPLFAANAALHWPEGPHMSLWHAATLLREHRGDGHLAALMASGIDGCQAHVLQVAAGTTTRAHLQPNRGWSDGDWATATDELRQRGWLAPDGGLTAEGRDGFEQLQRHTDDLASASVQTLGETRAEQLIAALGPLTRKVRAAGLIPYPNPMAVPDITCAPVTELARLRSTSGIRW